MSVSRWGTVGSYANLVVGVAAGATLGFLAHTVLGIVLGLLVLYFWIVNHHRTMPFVVAAVSLSLGLVTWLVSRQLPVTMFVGFTTWFLTLAIVVGIHQQRSRVV